MSQRRVFSEGEGDAWFRRNRAAVTGNVLPAEADRVLARSGWVVIHDFFTTEPQRRPYHHVPGLWSFKMDYRRLFDWHPNYVCKSHRVIHHVSGEHTDELQEWVAVSVLRKFSADD